MSKVSKSEEILLKGAELNGEEFRLYALIYTNTVRNTLICRKNLKQIAEHYSLDLKQTAAHYVNLREKGWCETTEQGIRPLVGIN